MTKTKTTKTTAAAAAARYVVVATASRPWLIACGRLVAQEGDMVTLEEARCAVYFSQSTRGLFGLAKRGPQPGSRVTEACVRIKLRVEIVLDATDAAMAAWQAEPWG